MKVRMNKILLELVSGKWLEEEALHKARLLGCEPWEAARELEREAAKAEEMAWAEEFGEGC
jgi:hypothetical protein